MLRESQTSVPHHRWVPLPPGLLLICVCVFSLSFWVSGGIAKYLSIVLLEAEVQSHKGTWNWSERFEFLNGQGWGDTDLPVRMWARALHDTVPLLICWFWLSLSYTRTLSFSLSLSRCCLLSLSLSLSSSSTGLSSSCRWSWLSWNCRATFPVVLATSCSITCLMTALLQDLWGSENLCHLDAYLYKHAGVNDWCILWYKDIFMIRVRSSPSAKMSRQYKVGRNPSVGKVNCVWMGALSGVRNVLGAVTHFARALCHSVVLQAFYNVWIFYTISDDIRG